MKIVKFSFEKLSDRPFEKEIAAYDDEADSCKYTGRKRNKDKKGIRAQVQSLEEFPTPKQEQPTQPESLFREQEERNRIQAKLQEEQDKIRAHFENEFSSYIQENFTMNDSIVAVLFIISLLG